MAKKPYHMKPHFYRRSINTDSLAEFEHELDELVQNVPKKCDYKLEAVVHLIYWQRETPHERKMRISGLEAQISGCEQALKDLKEQLKNAT